MGLFCRADASLEEGTTTAAVLQFAVGAGEMELPAPPAEGPVVAIFRQVLADAGRDCTPVRELMERTAERLGGGWEPTRHSRELAGWIFQAARLGGLELRADGIRLASAPAERPVASRLNRHFSENGQPVVDARHTTCRFPAGHGHLIAAMDGTRSKGELASIAAAEFPELDFDRWLSFLADRGIVL